MFPSTLCVFVATMSLLAAVNGAVVQRDGTIHTSPTSSVVIPMNSTTPCPTTTTSSATVVVTPPMNSTTPCLTTTSSSATVVLPPTTSTTPCTTSSVPVVVTPPTTSTTPCTTSSVPVVTPCTMCPSVTTTASIPVTSTPTTSGGASCTGVQNWQASFAYIAGNQVIFNNQLFTAKQWTFNNEPPTHPDQWTAGGTCAQPINNKANCAGVAAWQSNVAYTTGNQVTFNNHLWSAVQWTQSNSPGDTSGLWKDLGACA